jgi:hypothetical protein
VSGLSAAYAAGLFYKPERKDPQQETNDHSGIQPGLVDSYETAMLMAANEEQKEAIARIKASSFFFSERAVKIVLGELPAHQPRMTEAQARKIVSTLVAAHTNEHTEDFTSTIMKEFNRIHGAPDSVGGSGIHRSIYTLNEASGSSITLMLGMVTLSKPDPNHPDRLISVDLLTNEVLTPRPTASPA